MKVRVRLLPVAIFVAVLMLSVRVSDVWRHVDIGVGEESAAEVSPTGTLAAAAESAAGDETDKTKSKAKSKTKAGEKEARKQGATKTGGAKPARSAAAKSLAKPGQDEAMEDFDPGDLSEAEFTVLRELSARRMELDRRERNIEMRSGLLKAAEKRVEQKIVELKAIQETIQAELTKKDEKQEAKMRSLVKIYEKMKPKDAARIFGRLDIDILLDVIDRMREAKSAPILAAMSSSKAMEVTVELVRRQDSNEAFRSRATKAGSRKASSRKANSQKAKASMSKPAKR